MKEDLLDRIRIASPCAASWESMSGSQRARFCSQCSLHVYDISQLTRREALDLIARTEGRLCARIYRRADGTVLTRDCPVGLRALRRRMARVAGASLAAVLGLFTAVGAQKRSQDTSSCQTIHEFTIQRKSATGQPATIKGTVLDPSGAIVQGVEVSLTNKKTKQKRKLNASEQGTFVLADLVSGNYDLAIEWPGFKTARLKKLNVKEGDELTISAVLQVAGETIMGIIVTSNDYESSNGTTIIKGDLIRKLPM